MAVCRKCGHSNDDNVKFCGGCGARMDVRQSTPPPLVFDLKPDEDSPKQPKREHRGSVPPPYEPRPASQPSEPKPKKKHAERSSSPGPLSKSCMHKGCLLLLVILLVCGGIAYLMYQDDEKEGRSILNSIETPEDTINIKGISDVSLSEDDEALEENDEELSEVVSSTDPSYTPARYAITAGSDKGKWETLQSGEIVYIYPSGTYAHSRWIKDGDKFYYVDVSGCRMKYNYAHDGFYAGSDGSWDKTVKCIDKNVLPRNGKDYLDISAQKWVFQMQTHPDGTISGTARHTYGEGVGVVEDCIVKSFGHSAYSIYNKKNEFVSYHMVVLDDGRTLRVSAAGETDVFHTSIGI